MLLDARQCRNGYSVQVHTRTVQDLVDPAMQVGYLVEDSGTTDHEKTARPTRGHCG